MPATADGFLDWLTLERRADLIDGKVFMHSPVCIRHAEILVEYADGVDVAEVAAGTVAREYVYSASDDREYFIDRVGDPAETRNRAGVKFFADRKEPAKKALLNELIANGETAGIEQDEAGAQHEWRRFPAIDIHPDPDFGLLIQDFYTPWADVELPGYTGE